MLDKLTNLLNSFVHIHEKLGVKYITMYLVYTLIIIAAINWKSLLIGMSEVVDSHKKQKHIEMMKERDEINKEINEIIIDLRRSIRADRILVIEFHNTVSNVAGVPFKFMSVTATSERRNIPQIDITRYNYLNTGLFSPFLQDLKSKMYLELKDIEKACEYINLCNLLIEDKSKNAVAYNLTGLGLPLGFILVEWVYEESGDIDWEFTRSEIDSSSQSLNILLANSKNL